MIVRVAAQADGVQFTSQHSSAPQRILRVAAAVSAEVRLARRLAGSALVARTRGDVTPTVRDSLLSLIDLCGEVQSALGW